MHFITLISISKVLDILLTCEGLLLQHFACTVSEPWMTNARVVVTFYKKLPLWCYFIVNDVGVKKLGGIHYRKACANFCFLKSSFIYNPDIYWRKGVFCKLYVEHMSRKISKVKTNYLRHDQFISFRAFGNLSHCLE